MPELPANGCKPHMILVGNDATKLVGTFTIDTQFSRINFTIFLGLKPLPTLKKAFEPHWLTRDNFDVSSEFLLYIFTSKICLVTKKRFTDLYCAITDQYLTT